MEIETRVMRYVVAVADAGGFQRAADRLHMAQPPLSRQIRDLEYRLGVQLFERRPLRPTPAGEVFIKQARTILNRTAQLAEETRLAAVGQSGRVRLGYVLSAAYDTMPVLLAELGRKHPHISVEPHEDWSRNLERMLLRGELDLVIAHTVPEQPEFEHAELRRESLVAVVAVSHRLSGRDGVRLGDFAGDTFVFYDHQYAPAHYRLLTAALETTGEHFERREDMLPGLRNLRLPDNAAFTLVPASMSASLPADTRPLRLLDTAMPTIDTRLIWQKGTAPPAAYLVRDSVQQVARVHSW